MLLTRIRAHATARNLAPQISDRLGVLSRDVGDMRAGCLNG